METEYTIRGQDLATGSFKEKTILLNPLVYDAEAYFEKHAREFGFRKVIEIVGEKPSLRNVLKK